MTGSALLTLIATVLTAEAGVVEVDLGSRGGLRPGDQGIVFYEVVLDDEVQTIEIGSASVVETTSFTAKLKVAEDLPARPGFLVRFDLPAGRGDPDVVSEAEAPLVPESPSRSVQLSAGEPDSGASIAYVSKTGGACLKVRSLPTTASPEADCLAEGTAVAVIEEVPAWSRALLEDGRRGWLASRFLSASPPQSENPAPTETTSPRVSSPPAKPSQPVARPRTETPKVAPESIDADSLLEELERAEALVRRQISQLAASQDAVLEAHEARSELSRRLFEATVEEYQTELATTKDRLEESEQGRDRLADEYDRLQANLAIADTELQRVDAERERLVEQLEATNKELAEIEAIATAAKDALRREIRATETALGALRGRLEQRENELAETEAKLAAGEAERKLLVAESGASESERGSDSKREAKDLEIELAEARREKQALETWLDERGDELARAEAKVAIMQSEIDRLEAIGPRNRQEIENTRAALADASRRAADLEARLAASEGQKRDLESELAAARIEPGGPPAADDGLGPPSEPPGEAAAAPSAGSGVTARMVVLATAQPCLNFRTEPRLDSQAFDCLPPGTRLGPLGNWQEWHYVELVDGRAGWVASRHLGPASGGGSGP